MSQKARSKLLSCLIRHAIQQFEPPRTSTPLSCLTATQQLYHLHIPPSQRHHFFSTSTSQIDTSTNTIDKSEFKESIQFLLPKVSMSSSDIEDLLVNLAYRGFRSTGQMYERSFPIHLNFNTNIKPVIEFLEAIPGVNLTRTLKSSPYILLHANDMSILRNNVTWLTNTLQLQGNELGKLINGNAYVISRPVELTVKPCIDFLEGLGFTMNEVRSIVLRFPRVMAFRTDRLEYTIRGLRDIGLSDEQIKTVLWKFPGMFALSLGKIGASINWLKNQGIYSPDAINTCIVRFPTLLSFSITTKLDPMISLFKNDLGLSSETIKNVLIYAPDTMGRKKELILRNIDAMKDQGFNQEQLARFLKAYPGALRNNLNSEPYASKLKFLRDVLERDVPSTLATHPMYITYHIDRISTRAQYLMQMGRSTSALSTWLSCTDENFAEKHALSTVDDWQHYKQTALSFRQ